MSGQRKSTEISSQCVSADMNVSKSTETPSQPGRGLVVKCGKNSATFHPDKMRTQGRKLGKCIYFKGKWVTPTEFESMSQVQARKWKQSIKFEGKPIGDWRAANELEIEFMSQESCPGHSPYGNTETAAQTSVNNDHDNTSAQSQKQCNPAVHSSVARGENSEGSHTPQASLELTQVMIEFGSKNLNIPDGNY